MARLALLMHLLLLSVVIGSLKGHKLNDIINRDVCVIGGGAAGTYTVVRLQEMGKTVCLIEQASRLGGHVNTYRSSTIGKTFDYGVVVYGNISVTHDYFRYLHVPYGPWTKFQDNQTIMYADFDSGTRIEHSSTLFGNATDQTERYVQLLETYAPYVGATGYTASPIPAELNAFYQAAADALQQPTLYMLRNFNQLQFTGFLTVQNNNQLLYDTAYNRLGGSTNVFLNSIIDSIDRSGETVTITLAGPDSQVIEAQQLVLAIPPIFGPLSGFLDLTSAEQTLLGRFKTLHLWAAIVADTGIPGNVGINNVNASGQAYIPDLPTMLEITPSGIEGDPVHAIYWASEFPMSESDVRTQMLATVERVASAYGYSSPTDTVPTIVEFFDHSPYMMTVPAEDIRGCFYDELNALQGQSRSWWTGAAWESEDSAAIWNFTEYQVLPKLMMALGSDV